MAQNEAGQSTDEEQLKHVFDDAMNMYNSIENGNDATNSDPVQMSIKAAISKFEKATNLVSLSGMFSRNESIEELPTETLQYLLLPALLGTLSLKLCSQSQTRKEIIDVAEIYFRDFLQRCKDYGVTNVEVPQPSDSQAVSRPQSEQAKIASMVMTREAKIKRYKEQKELKEKVASLSKAMSLPTVDDETKREYFTVLLLNYVNQALDELSSIEQEKPILDYMEKHSGETKPPKDRPHTSRLKPVIITRDAMQKAIYGIGYPSIPTMTVEEFYDQRVKEGTFPGSCIPHKTIQNTEESDDEADKVEKERLEEEDDEDELARKRSMDEYKDDHRRGWGNRHNRS